ncbi:MAG: cyclic nucleotide-binding domain-containing protein [Caulobacter sp.]|nr:cyclic nucleotide-binding domain-containing protein [Caulobacter sp.]
MTTTDPDPQLILARLDWFARQPPEQSAALLAAGRLLRLRAGEWVHGEGDEEGGILALVRGGLRLYAQAPGWREALIGLLQPGQLMGQSALTGGGPRLVTAICAEDSVVFSLSDRALRRVAADHPEVWRDVSGLIYRQLRLSIQTLAEKGALSQRAQLAARLLQLAGPSGRIAIRQGELAEIIGVTRKALNAWLGELVAAGAVRTGYGVIEVTDRRRLDAVIAAED